jgi:hypothetical protein
MPGLSRGFGSRRAGETAARDRRRWSGAGASGRSERRRLPARPRCCPSSGHGVGAAAPPEGSARQRVTPAGGDPAGGGRSGPDPGSRLQCAQPAGHSIAAAGAVIHQQAASVRRLRARGHAEGDRAWMDIPGTSRSGRPRPSPPRSAGDSAGGSARWRLPAGGRRPPPPGAGGAARPDGRRAGRPGPRRAGGRSDPAAPVAHAVTREPDPAGGALLTPRGAPGRSRGPQQPSPAEVSAGRQRKCRRLDGAGRRVRLR